MSVAGGTFTVMVVPVTDPYDPAFEHELARHIARSPGFFVNAPVVLDLEHCLGCTAPADYLALKAVLRRQNLIAVGVQTASTLQARAAIEAELALFAAKSNPAKPAVMPSSTATRLVTKPVRSGAQIYASGGDLIITASVSAGAEVIADGHIHIYGALRGRAIAGAAGDKSARIFVQHLDAELLCIAGRYLVSEGVAPLYQGASVEVALIEGRLELKGYRARGDEAWVK